MADASMNGRGFAPQAGSYQAYQAVQPAPVQGAPRAQQGAPHDGRNTGPAQSGGTNGVATGTALLGALLSVGLVVGIGVWGYQLMARDVSGVPVVRSVQGDMRVRPDDPGGAQAENQGFSVNAVAAAGGTAGPSDQIVLAPEPIDLTNVSAPLIDQLAAAQPRFAPQTGSADQTAATSQAAPVPVAPAQEQELSPEMAAIQALADKISSGATPLSGTGPAALQPSAPPVQTTLGDAPERAAQPAPGTQSANLNATAPALEAPRTQSVPATAISPTTPGVAVSLRPNLRPAELRTASLQGDITAGAPTQTRDVDPASIPAGTRLVQLGAYESPEIARTEWDRFSARFGDYMAGKDRVVQRAQSGGRTFFRLRVMGFSDLSDARRFCSAFTAQNTDCIPVVTR